MNPTIKKIILFLGIILIGIIGLMVADQHDFLQGRTETQNTIGNGVPDPLVTGTSVKNNNSAHVTTGSGSNLAPSKIKTSNDTNSGIDGIEKR
jgi:hypothetical protein